MNINYTNTIFVAFLVHQIRGDLLNMDTALENMSAKDGNHCIEICPLWPVVRTTSCLPAWHQDRNIDKVP